MITVKNRPVCGSDENGICISVFLKPPLRRSGLSRMLDPMERGELKTESNLSSPPSKLRSSCVRCGSAVRIESECGSEDGIGSESSQRIVCRICQSETGAMVRPCLCDGSVSFPLKLFLETSLPKGELSKSQSWQRSFGFGQTR